MHREKQRSAQLQVKSRGMLCVWHKVPSLKDFVYRRFGKVSIREGYQYPTSHSDPHVDDHLFVMHTETYAKVGA